ncbi:MAG TPA: DUF4388 domain-containing protein [Burkholderiales bacterium]|nr:DUF4388 domain-containing protein [Burkholderiales bacterium]
MSQAYVPSADLVAALGEWSRERLTGIVYVATDTNHAAQINLVEGEITFVVFKSRLGANALPLMQAIESCRFRFAEGVVAAPSRQTLPPTTVILEQLAKSASTARAAPVASATTAISSEAKTVIERALADYIGPMVTIVCAEHFEQPRDLETTIDALACEIPNPEHAIRFKEDVSRKLGLR